MPVVRMLATSASPKRVLERDKYYSLSKSEAEVLCRPYAGYRYEISDRFIEVQNEDGEIVDQRAEKQYVDITGTEIGAFARLLLPGEEYMLSRPLEISPDDQIPSYARRQPRRDGEEE